MTSAFGHGAIVYCLNSVKSADIQTGHHNGEKREPAPIDNRWKPVLKESRRLGWCRENVIIETGGVMDKYVRGIMASSSRRPRIREGKALPWIERTYEESPGWNRLEENPGWMELEESAKERNLVRD
ncbi:hypothetical protein TNCV_3544211 [Trichonephila clavipes]|nr:hypothetical protein TNCV_3544211 [Trichonephila clavipes]